MATNLWQNPTAAVDLANVGCDHGAYGTLTRSTTDGVSGSTSFRVEKTGAGGIINLYNSQASGVEAGMTYVFDFWVKSPSANVYVTPQVVWYDSGGSYVDGTEKYPALQVTSTFAKISNEFIAPANTAKLLGVIRFVKDAIYSADVDVGSVAFVADVSIAVPELGNTAVRRIRQQFQLRPY